MINCHVGKHRNLLGSIAGVLHDDGSVFAYAGVFERPVPVDLNGDCLANIWDLFLLLSEWGTGPSIADLNADGTVNVSDLLYLLARWG